MKSKFGIALAFASMIALAACQKPAETPAGVTDEKIATAASNTSDWLSYGRTYDEQRYSPLDAINDKNVEKLGLAWSFEVDTNRGQEATPLVIDGVIYTTTSWSKVYALDARTGKELWHYDPKVPGEYGVKGCCDVVNRGLGAYGDKLYLGTFDGRLVALDRKTGAVKWEVDTRVDKDRPYTITGAPRIVKGKVVIGNGGGELGVRGYVTAYDAETGQQAWRFFTVPGDPAKGFEQPELEMAAKTWSGKWWEVGGGGTAWDSMAYDPELDLLYIGVGNGSPWNHKVRSEGKGDNLFLSSIVAVKPETGKYVWHYQQTPGESWDFTATQHIMLADLKIGGETKKVLMQAPKNGFFYVLDRATGKLISAKNFVPVNWASGIDMKTGRPVENPGIRYPDPSKPVMMLPGAFGAHNWQPMAFSAKTGLVYIPAQQVPLVYGDEKNFKYRPGLWNTGVDHMNLALPESPEQLAQMGALVKGNLIAWDPVNQKEVWRTPDGGIGNGGLLATAGNIVFQGMSDGRFMALAADTGKTLWSTQTTDSVLGSPITFALDGVQYVAVMVGRGGSSPLAAGFAYGGDRQTDPMGRLMVFKLDGKAPMPVVDMGHREKPDLSQVVVDKDKAARGKRVYHEVCGVCHGLSAISGGVTPDLRYSGVPSDPETFRDVVLNGALKDRGMVGFKGLISEEDAEATRHYILSEAKK